MQSLKLDPDWSTAMWMSLSTPAVYPSSTAAVPERREGRRLPPAVELRGQIFRQINSYQLLHVPLLILDSWRVEWPCLRSNLSPNGSTRANCWPRRRKQNSRCGIPSYQRKPRGEYSSHALPVQESTRRRIVAQKRLRQVLRKPS